MLQMRRLVIGVVFGGLVGMHGGPERVHGKAVQRQRAATAVLMPFGLAVASDGAVWFDDLGGGASRCFAISRVEHWFRVSLARVRRCGRHNCPWRERRCLDLRGGGRRHRTHDSRRGRHVVPRRRHPLRLAQGACARMGRELLVYRVGRRHDRTHHPGGTLTQRTIAEHGDAGDILIASADGSFWLNNGPTIDHIGPGTAVHHYLVAARSDEFDTIALVVAPDGNLWFADSDGQRLGGVDQDGTVVTFPLSHREYGPMNLVLGAGMGTSGYRVLGCRPDRSVGRGHGVPLPAPGRRGGLRCPAPDGTLWFTEPRSGALGRITTAGQITEYPLPPATEPAVGPRPPPSPRSRYSKVTSAAGCRT